MAPSSRSEFEVTIHQGGEAKEPGAAGHIAATVKEQGARNAWAPLTFSILHSPGFPAQGMVPPTVDRSSHLS